MMKKGLLEKIYEAASIQRWNDHARPIELTELDKQAHKMLIVYIIAKQEEIHGRSDIHWLYLIEGGIFEFLHRVVLTDIKPTVFHKMMAKKGRELNEIYGTSEAISAYGLGIISSIQTMHFTRREYSVQPITWQRTGSSRSFTI